MAGIAKKTKGGNAKKPMLAQAKPGPTKSGTRKSTAKATAKSLAFKAKDSGIGPAAPKPFAAASVKDSRSGKSFDLPILKGTVGPDVVDIRKLYTDQGLFTYDPGYGATGSTASAITYIDGEEGILMHRGYRIEDLAAHSDFMEVCYLLLEGELPNARQKTAFEHNITYHTMLHEQIARFYSGFRRDAHPMAVMVAVVGALSMALALAILLKVFSKLTPMDEWEEIKKGNLAAALVVAAVVVAFALVVSAAIKLI